MPRIKEELLDRFEGLAKDPETDALEELWHHVHPDMAAMERARKAVLVTLASHTDVGSYRNRCHTLLVGPPGTGKTQLRDWVKYNVREAHGIGQKSSEAGLKGDMSGKEFTPGALNLAHGGVLCIEELDKFDKSERDALYEAMSEGRYEINQGEMRETKPAEIRCIATANDITKFADAVMNRFDFVVELEEYSPEETDEVSEQVYEGYWSAVVKGEQDMADPILPSYLKWVEPYEPNGDEETLRRIHDMRSHLIHDGGFTGNIRQKEAYLRISYTIAKLNRRDVTPFDFVRAVELIHPNDANGSLKTALTMIAKGTDPAELY